jgi:hypothetical protein
MGEAAPTEARAAAETKRPRLGRLSKSLLVALAGIALTGWLLPAYTRQWDGRKQKNRPGDGCKD